MPMEMEGLIVDAFARWRGVKDFGIGFDKDNCPVVAYSGEVYRVMLLAGRARGAIFDPVTASAVRYFAAIAS